MWRERNRESEPLSVLPEATPWRGVPNRQLNPTRVILWMWTKWRFASPSPTISANEESRCGGYSPRVLYFNVSIYIETAKGQHVSLGLNLWRFEGTVGVRFLDRRGW